MIRLYCQYHHNADSGLCDACSALTNYAEQRVSKCPHGYEKPTCVNCTTHCYRANERENIKLVMRFAGPRMLFRHPYLAIMHLIDGWREHKISPKRA